MVAQRTLPERRNPLITPENSPSHEVLVDRRRLGQTNLALKPGTIGVTPSATNEHMGTFDYAHLRVPLPKDLNGSGIFSLKATTAYPESYFLMRRSSDGYISATGMFKAAFPWATLMDEEAERRFQKTLPSAGAEEVAGSVWVAPEEALQLSEEYGMRPWIEALLDNAPIEKGTKGTKDRNSSQIKMPPKYESPEVAPPVILPPSSALRSTRSRSSRSASPSKIATPSRKMASPRKSRTTRAAKAAQAEEATLDTARATSALQNVMENGTTASESVASESVNGDVVEKSETIRIEVQETVEQNGDIETTATNVKIDVPADHPELPTPEDPTQLIEEAKKMVEEARKLEGEAVKEVKPKRKAEQLSKDDDAEVAEEERPAKQAKKTYTTEQKLTKEKVTRRALTGVAVMAAIAGAFQYFA